jgi:Rrf2 family transcriptional regulator, cysteine metabolism repressor
VNVSQKSRYALKAVLELAFRFGQGPISISQIAKAQAIPSRFLEAILAQLKRGGFVVSRRGNEGGYLLARVPGEVSVGDVLRILQGPPLATLCANHPQADCPHGGDCIFAKLWERACTAVDSVYDTTNFQDLADSYRTTVRSKTSTYSI